MNLNKVFILGRLTRDPEQRAMPSGRTVSNFGMATNRIWNSPDSGERQEQTEFHNIVAFGKLAEICNQYLSKGQLVLIEGRVQTRTWEDQGGNKRSRTEIIAESMQMGPKAAGTSGALPQEPGASEDVSVVEIDEGQEQEDKKSKKPASGRSGWPGPRPLLLRCDGRRPPSGTLRATVNPAASS